jgi:GNAT superfamily N-acetyltransferase
MGISPLQTSRRESPISWTNRSHLKRMLLNIRPFTPELWPAFEDLFGKGGASNGCWCMYWRIGSQYHERSREKNRNAFRKIVKQGPPPGLLAFAGERAIGWCQLTPRDNLRWLHQAPFFEPVDNLPVWSISCFYVRRGYRRQGVMSALIGVALRLAKHAKAVAVEAYPVDTTHPKSTTNVFTGTASAFRRAGFNTVARRLEARPVMRHDLHGID